ncbi:MAG: TraB/VirB10 family protein [Burkholderiales bacterium]|nr:TraB/VirB10 family protein [Burkholderiales bacterium]
MSNQYDAGSSKKKQNIILYGGVAIIVIFVGVIYFSTKKAPVEARVETAKPLQIDGTVSDNISDTEVYTAKTATALKNTQDQINDLSSKFQAQQLSESNNTAAIMKQFTEMNIKLENIKSAPIQTTQPISPLVDQLPTRGGKNIGLPGMDESGMDEMDDTGITSVNLSPTKPASSEVASKNSKDANGVKIKDMQTYLPTSFVKAKLITSLDAPAGGTAQDNPYPVLINITDNAQLPNSKRTTLKGCFVLAAGYGDVASERAYLRLEKMSCVTASGKVIDQKVEGFVAGEDGKAGLRGKLVSKAGSKVALALLSGTVGGLAQAFAQTATTLQQTPIGPTQQVNPSQSLGFAGATGVSSGFQQLSQYYINMAEKTFPVIEINDQRNVTIIFTQGIELPVNMNGNDNHKQLPINPN